MKDPEAHVEHVAQVTTTTTQHERVMEGLETAPPPTTDELHAFIDARPMTSGIELILDPNVVAAVEKYLEDVGDRLLVLQQLAAIVRAMPPAEAERFQKDLIVLYSSVGASTAVETVGISIKSEVKRLPGTVITALVTAIVTIGVAYLLLMFGIPPIQ